MVAAERPREFAWVVGGRFVRWGYGFVRVPDGARVTESWRFLPEGIAMFHDKYGEAAADQIGDRTKAARTGIPETLAAIKRIAEA